MLAFCSICKITLSLKKFQPAMGHFQVAFSCIPLTIHGLLKPTGMVEFGFPFTTHTIAAVSDPDPDRGNMVTKSCKYFYEWEKINCFKINNDK
jgi:hypothetical protein